MAYAMVRGELEEQGKRRPAPMQPGVHKVDLTKRWRGTDAGKAWFASLDGVS